MSQRKHPKQVGINLDLAKKERSRRILRIGKDRRANLIQRHRKVMEEEAAIDDDDEDINEDMHTGQDSLLLPHPDKRMRRMVEMKAVLFNPDPTIHLPACIYFRKALAIDKHPPLELVYICGVIPRLAELLAHSAPNIQYECSWCLTNVACGERHHVEALLEVNVIPLALNLMVGSARDNIREQCLWLVCNLASNPEITRDALLFHGVMPRLLSFMLLSPQPRDSSSPPCSSLQQPLLSMEEDFRQQLRQQQQQEAGESLKGGAAGGILVTKTPSLLAMAHVANLLSFLVRKDLPLPADNCTLLAIVHLSPALLQSPDEQVVVATCTTLANIFDGSPPSPSAATGVTTPGQALQLAMEKGVLRRLGDICLSSTSTDASRQASICLLAVVLKAENPLCRLAVLQRGDRTGTSTSPRGFQLLEWILAQLRILESKGVDDMALSNEFYLHTLNCLSVMLLESSESKHADQLVRGDLHLLLIAILNRNNSFEVGSQVGRCLCSLLLRGSVEAVVYMGPSLFPEVMANMLSSSDPHLLLLALSSIRHILHLQHLVSNGDLQASLDFMLQSLWDDAFYEALVAISISAQDEEMRVESTSIVEYADRVREEG